MIEVLDITTTESYYNIEIYQINMYVLNVHSFMSKIVNKNTP